MAVPNVWGFSLTRDRTQGGRRECGAVRGSGHAGSRLQAHVDHADREIKWKDREHSRLELSGY